VRARVQNAPKVDLIAIELPEIVRDLLLPRLRCSTVGKEVSMSNYSSNSSSNDQQGWAVCVNRFDIIGIASVQPAIGVSFGKERSGRVQANDCVDAASSNVLANKTANMR
jgi:hypothetical protein